MASLGFDDRRVLSGIVFVSRNVLRWHDALIASSNEPVRYNKRRYRGRSRIEIMFGRLKDLAPRRYSLRPMPNRLLLCHCLAASVIFWL